jgi:beta-lactamase class D
MRIGLIALALAAALSGAPAGAKPLCTIVADGETGAVLHERGDCASRVTPASTFKIALAVMGYDSGILTNTKTPLWPYRKGDPAWGGAAWTRPVDPENWMRHSVVWYSQRIARALGAARFGAYAKTLGYGNADLTGDPGKENGLERSWIGSSLKISPREQLVFLRKLYYGQLPVKSEAQAAARAIVERVEAPGGWTLAGKTGSAFPRRADGSLDRARGWGWYVGWATREGRVMVFARLDQDETPNPAPGGLRARAAFIAAWPEIAAGLR